MPVQADAGVGVDHTRYGVIQGLFCDVALVGEGHVPAVQALEGARRLARAESAAVAEDGGEVALARVVQLGLKSGYGTEVPGPAQPVLGVGERFQHTGRDHARLEQPFQEGRAIDSLPRPQPLHHGFAGHDLDVFVLGKCLIDGVGRFGEAGFQRRHEGAGTGGDAGLLGVACDVALVILPGDELSTVVAILLAARDAQVARFQLVDYLGEQANLEVAPVHLGGGRFVRCPPGQQRPPFLAHPGQVEWPLDGGAVGSRRVYRGRQPGLAVRPVCQEESDCLLGGAVLRGGDRGGMGQETQERRALGAIKPGKQRQVVVAGERRVRLALGQDRVGIGQQQTLDRAEAGVRFDLLVPARQHGLAQQGNERVRLRRLPGAMLVQRLSGPVVHARRQPHEHFGRVVQRPRDLTAQQRRHQRSALGRGHVRQHGGVEGAGLGGEVPELAVRVAGKHLIRHGLSPQPCKVGQVLAHPLWAGPRRVRLDLVPAGPGCPLALRAGRPGVRTLEAASSMRSGDGRPG